MFVTDESERYIVNYTFIDFEYMIIGLKIKDIDEVTRKKEFDDFDLSKLMITNDDNLKFYDQPSVQKIIDMQFLKTRRFQTYLFAFYIIFFVYPLQTYIQNSSG